MSCEISNFAKRGYESDIISSIGRLLYLGLNLEHLSFIDNIRSRNVCSLDEYFNLTVKVLRLPLSNIENSEHDNVAEAVLQGLGR